MFSEIITDHICSQVRKARSSRVRQPAYFSRQNVPVWIAIVSKSSSDRQKYAMRMDFLTFSAIEDHPYSQVEKPSSFSARLSISFHPLKVWGIPRKLVSSLSASSDQDYSLDFRMRFWIGIQLFS